jgi:hypothetical protein
MITVLYYLKYFLNNQRETYAATGISQGKNPPTINYTLHFCLSNFPFIRQFFVM